MNYSINNLTQVADCAALLSWAAKEKAGLEHERYTDERLATKFAETSVEINANLQSLLIEISANDAAIDLLPEGPSKDDHINKKTRLEYKKFLLETRRDSYGTIALLEKEMDLARVMQQLAEVDAFMAAVKTKQDELQG